MEEFMFIFRSDPGKSDPSPEEMQELLKKWQDWLAGIAAADKLADAGNRLGFQGRTLKAGNLVVDGPYAEIKENICGYIIVRSPSLDDAFKLADGCPILDMGGSVEVRNFMPGVS